MHAACVPRQQVVPDPVYRFRFPECDSLPPPVLGFKDVSFSYSGKKEDYLYQNLNFGIDLDSRIALCVRRAGAARWLAPRAACSPPRKHLRHRPTSCLHARPASRLVRSPTVATLRPASRRPRCARAASAQTARASQRCSS